MEIILSPTESNISGYKIGRSTQHINQLDIAELKKHILDGSFDICRLKINGNQPSLFAQLNTLGIPFEIFTMNYLNEIDIHEYFKYNPVIPEDFTAEPIQDTNVHPDFEQLLNGILNSKSWFEYESPLLDSLLPQASRKKLALSYYKSFCPAAQTNGRTWILRKDKEPIGLFMGNIAADHFYGVLYGIDEQYRNCGYSKYIYYLMFKECLKLKLNRFVNDVSLFNIASQKSAASSRMIPSNIYYNVTLYPFSQQSDHFIKISDSDTTALINIENIARVLCGEDWRVKNIKSNYFFSTEKYDSVLYREVIKKEDFRVLIIHLNYKNILQKICYIELQPY